MLHLVHHIEAKLLLETHRVIVEKSLPGVVIGGDGAGGAEGVGVGRDAHVGVVLIAAIDAELHLSGHFLGGTEVDLQHPIVVIHPFPLHEVGLEGNASGGVVGRLVVAAAETEVVTLRGGVTEEEVKPVGVILLQCLHALEELVLRQLPVVEVHQQSLVPYAGDAEEERKTPLLDLLGDLDALLRVHQRHLSVVGSLVVGDGAAVIDSKAPTGALLRRDDDDTIGGAYTVDRGGGGILQHIDLLDVHRVKSRDGVTDEVDIIERVDLLSR